MPRIPDDTQIQWETIGLPLAKGADLRDPSRAIEFQRLLRFENGRFATADIGIEKRRGHKGTLVRSSDTLVGQILTPGLPATVNRTPPPGGIIGTSKSIRPAQNWLYGYGIDTGSTAATGYLGVSSRPPYAGQVCGAFNRDKEALFWDGFRVFSWPSLAIRDEGWQQPRIAYTPTLRSTPIAKVPNSQPYADAAANEKLLVVAYLNPTTLQYHISVYDRATHAPYLLNQAIGPTSARHVRVLPSGGWIHVFVSTASDCAFWSIHESDPSDVHLGAVPALSCNGFYDVKQVNDNVFAWCRALAGSTGAYITFHRNDGSYHTGYANGLTGIQLDTGGFTVQQVAVDFAPFSGDMALFYRRNGTQCYGRIYDAAGQNPGPNALLYTGYSGTSIQQLTVAAYYLPDEVTSEAVFQAYVDEENAGSAAIPRLYTTRFSRSTTDAGFTRAYMRLASHAFRVGAIPFVLVRSKQLYDGSGSLLQQAYYIMDPDLLPAGKFERGTAAAPTLPQYGLPGVNYYEGQGERNRTRWHGIFVYRTRVDSVNNDQFDEESLKFFELDFIPRLRWAQYGRCTYLAGAQLSVYDGRVVVEQGFHEAPEFVAAINSGTGGLTVGGKYRYKARWAYKNAQGEEVLSPAIISKEVTSVGTALSVRYTTLPFTRKEGAYLLIYRNENNGTQWYLVSSRDPASANCPKNSLTADIVIFQDGMSDLDLLSKEKDVGDSGELEPFSAPASEIVMSGRDRLWLAGGELAPGDIMPSKLYVQGLAAAFNDQLLASIDRDIDPVTGFAFMGVSTLVFKRDRIYAMEQDGPNNLLAGGFDVPRIISADAGAIGPESITLTTPGVVFQSKAGFKMLATNYQVVDIGEPVRPRAEGADVVAHLMVPTDDEVRFYTLDAECFVFNYQNGEWAIWTNLNCAGVAQNPTNGYAILGKLTGHAWEERNDQVTDAGYGIQFVFRTAWIHRGLQNFARLRRMELLGDKKGDHILRVRVFYDDKDFPEDEFTWDPNDDLNTSWWGASTFFDGGGWGLGVWGDVLLDDTFIPVGHTNARSSVYQLRRRVKRQKCSRFSIEVSDQGHTSRGPAYTELALELGQKGGLTRLPARTFGS